MLYKKMIRTLFMYKAQFISMVIMVALGVGVFVGFNGEWYSLSRDGGDYFNDTEFADYNVYSESGFSEEDIDAVRGAGNIDAAVRRLEVNTTVKESKKTVSLNVYDGYYINKFYVSDGVDYDENIDGVWVSDKFADENGYGIGDEITVVYGGYEIGGEIVGLIKCPDYTYCVSDDSQIMPDYKNHGYMFVTPSMLKDALGMEFYSQILIKSDAGKGDIEDTIEACLGKTLLILSKDENASYVMLQSEVEEGQTMGNILPVIFLLIAVLTMVTTMHRITSNEKTQIGTLKALGYKDRKIVLHYTFYGLFIGILGTIAGCVLGYGIMRYVVNPVTFQGTCFDFPNWDLYIPKFVAVALAATLIVLTFISCMSVRKMLTGSAAEALLPYVPKTVKATFFEKGRAWSRLSFSTKWNLRDIFRHRSRSAMTLVGVGGCVIILLAAMGMNDTMGEFSSILYDDIYSYEYNAAIDEDADEDAVGAFVEKYDADTLCARQVKLAESPVLMEIYNITHDYVKVMDNNGDYIELADDGVYVCNIIAEDNDIKIGDTINISEYGSSENYDVKVIGLYRSIMTESVIMTEEYAESVGIPCSVTNVFTMENTRGENDIVASVQTRQTIVDSFSTFMEILNAMVFILVVAGALLSGIVLYNLGVMSYTERYRELATLKVIGFKDRQIGRLLISQNIWLTIVGIVIGIPLGYAILVYIIKELGSEYDLSLIIYPGSYAACVLLTLGVSLAVGMMVSRKNKKIDMVSSLKGAE